MNKINFIATIYDDAVKMEVDWFLRAEPVGWFRDEVSAIGAACEHVLMRSAISSELRRLPLISINCDYRPGVNGHAVSKFKRATRVKLGDGGRRIVMVPGAYGKPWICRPS